MIARFPTYQIKSWCETSLANIRSIREKRVEKCIQSRMKEKIWVGFRRRLPTREEAIAVLEPSGIEFSPYLMAKFSFSRVEEEIEKVLTTVEACQEEYVSLNQDEVSILQSWVKK